VSLLRPGTVLQSRYEILEEIGRGGYSIVYRAQDRQLGTEVAIKLLVPPPAVARLARERMRREVLAARRLSHANIVAVHDFADDGDHSFTVMEYVAGPDLAVRVRERGPLPATVVARLGQEMAAALSAGHRHGVLHRDIKPQNILLEPDGTARLADFGSARLDGHATLTATGAAVGTLDYMAPEVFRGQRGDARSDLYSLGLTLYFALSGRLPDRASPHLPPSPKPDGFRPSLVHSEVPPWLDAIIARLTAERPADRYPSGALAESAIASADPGSDAIVRPDPVGLDFCLLCGRSDHLGLGLCTGCDATAHQGNEISVLLHPPASAAERVDRQARVGRLLGSRATAAVIREVVEGRQVLARVPMAGAVRVLERLSSRGIPARGAVGRWLPTPPSLFLVAAGMVATGVAAGMVTSPLLFLVSPALAGLVVVDAQRRIRRPALTRPKNGRPFSPPVAALVADSFALLPDGAALELLGDIARNVHALKIRLAEVDAHAGADAAEDLLVHACAAARDLADIEAQLAELEQQRDRFKGGLARWDERLAESERNRDRLVQRLLDALAALGRSRAMALDASGAARDDLVEVSAELEREVAAVATGIREVEALLQK
jgi:protein kinase-like protein